MRNPVAPLFAVALITALVACANGSSDDPSTDVSATDPDSGVSTQPASNGGGGNNGGNNNTTDSGSGGGNTGADSGGGGNTGTDSGGGGAVDSGGGGTSMDLCDTSPMTLAGIKYTAAYTNLADPTAVPCPCAIGECCYKNGVWPAACLKK